MSSVVFTLHDDLGKATEEIIATSTRAASLQELAEHLRLSMACVMSLSNHTDYETNPAGSFVFK